MFLAGDKTKRRKDLIRNFTQARSFPASANLLFSPSDPKLLNNRAKTTLLVINQLTHYFARYIYFCFFLFFPDSVVGMSLIITCKGKLFYFPSKYSL